MFNYLCRIQLYLSYPWSWHLTGFLIELGIIAFLCWKALCYQMTCFCIGELRQGDHLKVKFNSSFCLTQKHCLSLVYRESDDCTSGSWSTVWVQHSLLLIDLVLASAPQLCKAVTLPWHLYLLWFSDQSFS
jgi:hypothetical protein